MKDGEKGTPESAVGSRKNITFITFKIIIMQTGTILEYTLPRLKSFLKSIGNPGNQYVATTSDNTGYPNYLSSGYNVEFFLIQVN